MGQTAQAVRWEKDGNVAIVWLCNPERRNAMGPAFWEQMPQVMSEIGSQDDVGAVALCAEGPAFSVGLDLKAMGETIAPHDAGEVLGRFRGLARLAFPWGRYLRGEWSSRLYGDVFEGSCNRAFASCSHTCSPLNDDTTRVILGLHHVGRTHVRRRHTLFAVDKQAALFLM
ncbi:enoyl-CoA hydratase/isomerase family protein [Thermodesulfobacteriota bacterium]